MNVALHPTYVSLFSGVGGLDVAVRVALPDSRCVCYCEREAFAVAVLAQRMEEGWLDGAPVWSDCTTLDYRPFRGLVGGVVAGFPCPPVSTAGKRKGVEDERWLWPEVVRAIRETRCQWVFLENVRGLLSANDGTAFGSVLGDLADLGFDAEWGVFSAKSVGASHRRERVFVLAHHQGDRRQLLSGSDGEAKGSRPSKVRGRGVRRQQRTAVDERVEPHRANMDDTSSSDGSVHPRPGRPGEGTAKPGGGSDSLADAEPAQRRREDEGRGEGRRVAAGGTGGVLEHASGDGSQGLNCPRRWPGAVERADGSGVAQGDAEGSGRPQAECGQASDFGPFAPGPGDPRWRDILAIAPWLSPAVEPGFRVLADGMAAAVDESRVDQLRAAGNGVVWQSAAVAFRVLWERLTC